jgi:hypothetical protein
MVAVQLSAIIGDLSFHRRTREDIHLIALP